MAETHSPQLPPGQENLSGFEYVSTHWDARIPKGVTRETLREPSFWAHHGARLKPFDEIRARAEDGTWIAQLIVLDCSRTWAKVQELSFFNLTTTDVSLTQASENEVKAFIEGHEVKWRGPLKWSVVRKSDGAVLTEGIEQKDKANEWLANHARTQVGAPAKLVPA